ncbi:MAG: c-type cytochrome [Bacteroidetes bacterium]|nr:c-type cytochrome [Bacteroidota bacterium]MBK8143546.1 c-type cytochrome [Bacteroidota bacterium]MBP6314040.1 c-type cytochrome [Chitinophagaceae bacterium]
MAQDFKGYILLLVFLVFQTINATAAPDGKALFQANCASCHNPYKDATGPALNGMDSRVPSKEWLYKWVKNSATVIASGDKYANDLYNKWNKTAMTEFPSLTTEEIDAIVTYVNIPKPEPKVAETPNGGKAPESDNTLLYAILTIILLVVVVVLTSVNKVLSRSANAMEGVPSPKDVPFFRNKVVIAVMAIIVIVGFGVWLTKGSELGRQKNYMPKQPIFYSHKVHAGINQINCLYCHSGAEKSRHAMIPSVNVCMNCHKQINEYTGADQHPLVTLEGKTVDGTKEIQKIYEYAGWDPAAKSYKKNANGDIMAKPIEWEKIHNMPDHVYFNHSLHVVSGKVACQRCHGNIEEMDEVYQFADLSMGWCVNCHRNTKVQFADNDYYSIFQKYHDEIKEGKRADVKVSDIGGLECQRCHY